MVRFEEQPGQPTLQGEETVIIDKKPRKKLPGEQVWVNGKTFVQLSRLATDFACFASRIDFAKGLVSARDDANKRVITNMVFICRLLR